VKFHSARELMDSSDNIKTYFLKVLEYANKIPGMTDNALGQLHYHQTQSLKQEIENKLNETRPGYLRAIVVGTATQEGQLHFVYESLYQYNDIENVLDMIKINKNSDEFQSLIDILEKIVNTNIVKKNMNSIYNLLIQLYYIKSQKVYGSGINDKRTFKTYKKYGTKMRSYAIQITKEDRPKFTSVLLNVKDVNDKTRQTERIIKQIKK
jgi:hypothetical protein